MSKAVAISGCNTDIGGMREEMKLSPTEKKEGPIRLISRFLRLDTGRRASTDSLSSSESPTSSEPAQTYYAVYIPCEIKKECDEETIHVYKNKFEALELVKKYKLARFKVFRNYQDAVSFALRGADVESHDVNDNSLIGEKPCPFKAPSPQEMVSLRKAIEAGLIDTVRDRIWDNPRYLVSSGNSPAILQEGSRYNALHVAAKALNAEMCNLILTIVGDPFFVQTLYGMDTETECCKEFAEILVDRYLNTPDKSMNETPLHFAAKFGGEAAVEVLTSFPQCNREATNKFGEKPADVVCQRNAGAGSEVAGRIARSLQERYYVPAVHCEDDSLPPRVGRVFTPARPPELNADPLSPRHEILAYAGPMRAECAELFRRRWKTPPCPVRPPALRIADIAKGLENVGRNLASEMNVGWKEYWPFLDTFTDFRTPEGLTLLENYLKHKYESACSFAYNDTCIETHNSPDDISISRISLNISQTSPLKDATMSPMSELCAALKTCTISSDRPAHYRKTDPIRQRLCRQPTKLINGEVTPPMNHTVSQLLCIERTCQVFAKRIADALVFSLTAEPEVAGESLKSEAKHLQHTMLTYMDDARFQSIDFSLIHSRLAQLVVFKLKQQTIELDDINHLVEFLVKLRCPNDDIFSSDDERKSFRGPSRVKSSYVIDVHVRCLASYISEELMESDVAKGPSISESECTEIWEKASKCGCEWKIESFERNSKKNASFRRNRSILSTSPKSDSLIKRLNFDHDIGDGRGQPNESSQPLSVNSPAGDGDGAGALYTVLMDKCTVLEAEAEISDDEESGSNSEGEEAYLTASEDPSDQLVEEDEDMHDASDRAIVETFIYGEEPSKMDRLVYDAVAACRITADKYPNIYRWRHTVTLYTPDERNGWKPVNLSEGGVSPVRLSLRPPPSSPSPFPPASPSASPSAAAAAAAAAARCSTPKKQDTSVEHTRNVNLQVSSWLRVTGPNSPRSASATKCIGHNASFGF